MGWKERWQGEACGRCDARRDLLVVISCLPPFGVHDWHYRPSARCVDTAACAARVEKRQDRARQRSGLLVLAEPKAPDAPVGSCRWCGAELNDQANARRYGRRYCRDDREGRDCRGEWNASRTWDARVAVRYVARQEHGVVACVDCGIVCEGADPMDGTDAVAWEADHELALEDGGEHSIENLRCRCVPCHRAKSGREAAARAEGRRIHTFQASQIPAFMDAMRDPLTSPAALTDAPAGR